MGVDECAVLRSGRSVDAEAIAKCIETMPGAGELLRGFFQCVDDRIFRPDVIDEVAFIAKEADVVSSVMDDKLGVTVQEIKNRSEEHTSELQSLMRISYAVFCLKKKNNNQNI